MSYQDVIEALQSIWYQQDQEVMEPQEVNTIVRMKNQRRVPRSVRKEKGQEKLANKMNSIASDSRLQLLTKSASEKAQDDKDQVQYDSPLLLTTEEDCMWTVINNRKIDFTVRGLNIER